MLRSWMFQQVPQFPTINSPYLVKVFQGFDNFVIHPSFNIYQHWIKKVGICS